MSAAVVMRRRQQQAELAEQPQQEAGAVSSLRDSVEAGASVLRDSLGLAAESAGLIEVPHRFAVHNHLPKDPQTHVERIVNRRAAVGHGRHTYAFKGATLGLASCGERRSQGEISAFPARTLHKNQKERPPRKKAKHSSK